MGVACAILLLAFVVLFPGHWRTVLKTFRRLRWLLLSILIVYLLFSPEYSSDAITMSLLHGLRQVTVLLLMVLAACLLLISTPRQQLLYAIYWLSRPLSIAGLSPQRLAARMMLVIERVETLQELFAHSARQHAEQESTQKLAAMANRLGLVFDEVVKRAEKEPLEQIELAELSAPSGRQWLWPLAIVAGFVLISEPMIRVLI